MEEDRKKRIELIKELERIRGAHVITYITSTRSGQEVQMAMDCIPRVYEHLRLIKGLPAETKIDLFLCSNGGDGTVPWRLVTLIREFTNRFSVLVPYQAFSAATLTALGADEIVMHPMGMLGPTDPTVANQFTPPDPTNPTQRLGISVEDVSAYVSLVRDDCGITHEDELVQAFSHLAGQVHPLALGNVKRSIAQSQMMARKLLGLHRDAAADEHLINEIVDNLTSKSYYHGHPINRTEAKDQIRIPTIADKAPEVEEAMWQLYLLYAEALQIDTPFDVTRFLYGDMDAVLQLERTPVHPNVLATPGVPGACKKGSSQLAFIESSGRCDVFQSDFEILGFQLPDGNIAMRQVVKRLEWNAQ